VWGDTRRLRQVWINLLTNAVKFTPAEGRVNVNVSVSEDGAIAIAVSDTGIGIAAADIERVLQPFSQVETALSRGHEGTGLGLALTRSLVELHGGRLAIDSEVGIGTTVTVILPADRRRTAALLPQQLSGDAQDQLADNLAFAQAGNGAGSTIEGVDFAHQRTPLAAG
jgi:signal transduction histidine kinase